MDLSTALIDPAVRQAATKALKTHHEARS